MDENFIDSPNCPTLKVARRILETIREELPNRNLPTDLYIAQEAIQVASALLQTAYGHRYRS